MNYVRKPLWVGIFPKKPPQSKRSVYLRITVVDGIPKETFTKRKWDSTHRDQKTERAIGTKEDAGSLNFFLDSLILKINEYKTEIMYSEKPVTSEKIINYYRERLLVS